MGIFEQPLGLSLGTLALGNRPDAPYIADCSCKSRRCGLDDERPGNRGAEI